MTNKDLGEDELDLAIRVYNRLIDILSAGTIVDKECYEYVLKVLKEKIRSFDSPSPVVIKEDSTETKECLKESLSVTLINKMIEDYLRENLTIALTKNSIGIETI